MHNVTTVAYYKVIGGGAEGSLTSTDQTKPQSIKNIPSH